jgi:hypothetical protein
MLAHQFGDHTVRPRWVFDFQFKDPIKVDLSDACQEAALKARSQSRAEGWRAGLI